MNVNSNTLDEKLVQAIRMLTPSQELFIVDSRPQVNAVANSFKKVHKMMPPHESC